MTQIYAMPFAKVYPQYVDEMQRHGRTQDELDEVIEWLAGFEVLRRT